MKGIFFFSSFGGNALLPRRFADASGCGFVPCQRVPSASAGVCPAPRSVDLHYWLFVWAHKNNTPME